MTAEGKHAERLLAFQRGEGSEARIVVVPRLMGGLGAGAPIGARWDDTRLRIGDEGTGGGGWRCLLSGVDVPVHDGFVAASAVLAELPVAVLAPTKSV
jgi:maltooligosyltrehalose synthase